MTEFGIKAENATGKREPAAKERHDVAISRLKTDSVKSPESLRDKSSFLVNTPYMSPDNTPPSNIPTAVRFYALRLLFMKKGKQRLHHRRKFTVEIVGLRNDRVFLSCR